MQTFHIPINLRRMKLLLLLIFVAGCEKSLVYHGFVKLFEKLPTAGHLMAAHRTQKVSTSMAPYSEICKSVRDCYRQITSTHTANLFPDGSSTDLPF